MLTMPVEVKGYRSCARIVFRICWFLLFAGLFGGCNLPLGERPTNPISSESVQDIRILATLTQQVGAQQIQGTLPAPTSTQHSAVASPTQPQEDLQPLPSLDEEVYFLPGGTIAFLEGNIAAGQGKSFTFDAQGGQTLLAGVSSNDQDVFFEIKGLEDGVYLASFADEITSISAILPSTQTYRITLTSRSDNVYFLTVEIPARIDVKEGSGPLVLDGAVHVWENVHPNVFTRVRYLLDLEAAMVLNVQLNSPSLENLTLALTGVEDGVPYLRYVVKSDGINDFHVPVSQEYFLDVYNTGITSSDYSLEIEVRQ